jgi:hypothetical protein
MTLARDGTLGLEENRPAPLATSALVEKMARREETGMPRQSSGTVRWSSCCRWLGAAVVAAAAGASGASAAEPPAAAPPFGWFGELAGACWSGTDAQGKPTDRQCYWRQYGLVRGTIELFAGSVTGRDSAAGDSLFLWDAASGEIRYDTWSSLGAVGSGVARFEGARLVFPQAGRGEPQDGWLRTAWERVDADSFRVVQERLEAGAWRPNLTFVYRREAAAPAPPPASVAPAPGGPLEPFAFLADSCWLGTFADGKTKDEICYEWTLGGRFLRSRHRVVGGKSPYEGETIFAFDPRRGKTGFVYWNAAGSVMRGDAEPRAGGVDFPVERVSMGGESFEIRSAWTLDPPDRYSAVTSKRADAEWRELFRIDFVRVAPFAWASAAEGD